MVMLDGGPEDVYPSRRCAEVREWVIDPAWGIPDALPTPSREDLEEVGWACALMMLLLCTLMILLFLVLPSVLIYGTSNVLKLLSLAGLVVDVALLFIVGKVEEIILRRRMELRKNLA